MENVVVMTFRDPAEAREAMNELGRVHGDGVVNVKSAAVVERAADGRFSVPEQDDNVGFAGTASGALVGTVLGALVGPVGLLFGGIAGLAIGAAVDAEESDASDLLLSALARRVPSGTSAVVADVEEPNTEVLDDVVTRLHGQLFRHPRAEVEAELEAAEEAAAAADREARRIMRKRREARGEQTLGDRLAAVKDKVTGET